MKFRISVLVLCIDNIVSFLDVKMKFFSKQTRWGPTQGSYLVLGLKIAYRIDANEISNFHSSTSIKYI